MEQIDNSISIENLKKMYTSTIGKISSIKQKKYMLTKKYMIKTSEIYLNEKEQNINSELEAAEKELKEKIYELNLDKKEQIEKLENISKICKSEIEAFYEQLNIYADMNKYFDELYKCEEAISRFNEALKNRQIQIFVGNEKRDLFEVTQAKQQLLETISQVIPSFETNVQELIKKYKSETSKELKQKQKELEDYMDLEVKLNNVLNEKLDDELIILDAVRITRRKRIVQEIKRNLNKTTEILTEERRRQMEEAEKEFEAQQSSVKLTEERRCQMEEAEKEFETQQSSEILTEERRRQMEEAEKEFEAHQRETIITSEEKKLSKQEKLKQLKETMKQLNNLETTEKLVIPKSNSTAKLIRTSAKPEEKKYNIQTNNQNPMIEKEIPIEAKISRQVPEQKTKTICERIKERIHNYLYSKKEYSTKTR